MSVNHGLTDDRSVKPMLVDETGALKVVMVGGSAAQNRIEVNIPANTEVEVNTSALKAPISLFIYPGNEEPYNGSISMRSSGFNSPSGQQWVDEGSWDTTVTAQHNTHLVARAQRLAFYASNQDGNVVILGAL